MAQHRLNDIRRWWALPRHRNLTIGVVLTVVAVVAVTVMALAAYRARNSAFCLDRLAAGELTALARRDQITDEARVADIGVKTSERDTLTRIAGYLPTPGRAWTQDQIQAIRDEIGRHSAETGRYIDALTKARSTVAAYPLPDTSTCVPPGY